MLSVEGRSGCEVFTKCNNKLYTVLRLWPARKGIFIQDFMVVKDIYHHTSEAITFYLVPTKSEIFLT